MMKVTFVVPKDDDRTSPLNQYSQGRVLPPVGLGRMAGLAGKHASVNVVDERIASARHTYRADIAVFIINSYNRERCLVLAKLYRDSGSYVVFSGAMLATDADEPALYADSLLVGYGEECIAKFLLDYKQGKPNSMYYSEGKARSMGLGGLERGQELWSLAS